MPSFDVVSRNDMAKGQASKNTARRGLMMTPRIAMSPLRPPNGRQPNPDYDLPETAGHRSQTMLWGFVVVDLTVIREMSV